MEFIVEDCDIEMLGFFFDNFNEGNKKMLLFFFKILIMKGDERDESKGFLEVMCNEVM